MKDRHIIFVVAFLALVFAFLGIALSFIMSHAFIILVSLNFVASALGFYLAITHERRSDR